MNESIEKINQTIQSKGKYSGPKFLYKYRPFDSFTFDMLKNQYLYLCPAENLDDKSECNTTLDLARLMDLETNNLKRECVEQIIQMVKPYTSEENYELISSKIYMIMNGNGTVRPNFMLDLSMEIQDMVPNMNVAPLVNYIVGIPEKLDDPSIRPQMEQLISIAMNAKKKIGICSLSESCDIDRMWMNYYAGNDAGYCVEYDVSEYVLNKAILPVVYDDARETNIIIQLVANFINQMISGFSNGAIQTDQSQYIRLFLNKNTDWDYQREWRLIGDAGEKARAPKINRIILGKNVSCENKKKMKDYCSTNGISIKQR